MNNNKIRETLYFKAPVFLIDLCIHLSVMLFLLSQLSANSLTAITESEHWRVSMVALMTVSFSIAIATIHLKLHERRIKIGLVIWRAIKQTILTNLLFVALVALVYKEVPRHLLFYQFCISMPIIALFHYIANQCVRALRKLGHNTRNVIMIGIDETQLMLYKELMYGHAFTGYNVAGFFTSVEDAPIPEGQKLLGKVSDFFDWIKHNQTDEIYCSLPPSQCEDTVNRIIKICNDKFIEFYFVPTFEGYPKRQLTVRNIGKVNFIKLREEPLNSPLAKLFKRSFDVLMSSLFLCTLYPFVLLFVWIGNKVTGNVGPLYFRQARTGYNGQRFYIYKFRSMKVNKDADKLQATKDDPRKTPFGDFLRRSSIDELPQFINVFLGDMSIIGPRPHMEYHTEMYSSLIGDYMVRHLAKPGITGWAQINGCRGETKTVEEMQARVEHDIWYIENWSALLDIEIFFRTMWQVIPGHDKQAY